MADLRYDKGLLPEKPWCQAQCMFVHILIDVSFGRLCTAPSPPHTAVLSLQTATIAATRTGNCQHFVGVCRYVLSSS